MFTKINKSDIILMCIIISISSIFLLINTLTSKKGTKALIYYDNKLIKTIDLSYDKTYTVKGYNGDVVLVVKNNRIKVASESSPLHLCSKQGYISKSYESIVCLPNKIVIEISSQKLVDTVVR